MQKKRKMMARFRCGNEERKNRYWMRGVKRRCRMCYDIFMFVARNPKTRSGKKHVYRVLWKFT
jgi:hypothetical protein